MSNSKLLSIYALYKGECIINLSLGNLNQNIPQLCRLFLGLTSFFEYCDNIIIYRQEISHMDLPPNYYSIYSSNDLIIVLETDTSDLKYFYSFILMEIAKHLNNEDLKLLNISKQNPEDYTIDSSLQTQNLQKYQTKTMISYFVSNYLKPILLCPLPNLHQIPFISIFLISIPKQSILFQFPQRKDLTIYPYSFIYTELNYNLFYRVCDRISKDAITTTTNNNNENEFKCALIYDLAQEINGKKYFITFYYYLINSDYCIICCKKNNEILKESSIPFPLIDLPTTDKQIYFFDRDKSVIPDLFQPYLSDLLQYISLLIKPIDNVILKPQAPPVPLSLTSNGNEENKIPRYRRNLHVTNNL